MELVKGEVPAGECSGTWQLIVWNLGCLRKVATHLLQCHNLSSILGIQPFCGISNCQEFSQPCTLQCCCRQSGVVAVGGCYGLIDPLTPRHPHTPTLLQSYLCLHPVMTRSMPGPDPVPAPAQPGPIPDISLQTRSASRRIT